MQTIQPINNNQNKNVVDENDENIDLKITANNDLVKISLIPTDNLQRNPADIVCVIDVSGSMGTAAAVQNASGVVEDLGLNILEVVKQAVQTIAYNLGPNDRLSIVTFTDKANVDLDLTEMDQDGQQLVVKILESLDPLYSTNLWDGLYNGLEVIRMKQDPKRIATKAVLLLTDGMPNVIPPRGHLPMLQKYLKANPLNCTVHTYGFGYSLDNKLLLEIAEETQGMYSFIPDGGFVGTVFINTISNILTTMARSAQISLDPLNGSNFQIPYSFFKANKGINFNFGTVQYGQSRDIVLPIKIPKDNNNNPYLRAQVNYTHTKSAKTKILQLKASDIVFDPSEIEIHRLRLRFVDQVNLAYKQMIISKMPQAQNILNKLIQEIRSSFVVQNKFIQDLLKDLEGQVVLAFSRKDWFDKWGQHYIPSLLRAHYLQQCNNFKDPGVQHYGGRQFKMLREKGDDIFINMPPLTKNKKVFSNPNFTMRSFHSSSNPCFDGDSLVQMADNTYKFAKDIQMGDIIKTGFGHLPQSDSNLTAKIQCVVKTVCDNEVAELVQLPFGGPLVTPWHPVYIDGKWKFPIQIQNAEAKPCPAVYSFVLDKPQRNMIINGVQGCTLGHQFSGNAVIEHPYFGTTKIINDLKKKMGWYYGYVELNSGCIQRDYKTGLVNGLQGGFTRIFSNYQQIIQLYKFVFRRLILKA